MDTEISILNIIYAWFKDKGYAPSVRELCELADIKSTSTIHRYIEKLKDEGYLYKEGTKSRAWELTPKALHLFEEPKKEVEFTSMDYKVLLACEKVLTENRFTFLNEFKDIKSRILKLVE